MWHVNVFMHRLRNRWLLSTSRSVLRGQLWRAALSWRYAIRMKAASQVMVCFDLGIGQPSCEEDRLSRKDTKGQIKNRFQDLEEKAA